MKLLLLRVLQAYAQHLQEQTCAFLSFAHAQPVQSGFSQFWYKSFCYSMEKSARLRLLLLKKKKKNGQNPEL